jgi:hypothetical protein
MKQRASQIALAVFALIMLVTYNQCGNPYQTKPTELKFQDGNSAGALASEDSVGAYRDTVYKITRQRCANCHTTQNPPHAHNNVKVAHDSVVNQRKVNFSNIPNSIMVTRLSERGHYCWSDCAQNAKEMEDAIGLWYQTVQAIEQSNNNNTGGDEEEEEVTLSVEEDNEISQEAYKDSVWNLTRQHCVSCHINNQLPMHANDDYAVAHDSVVERGAALFNNIPQSLLVHKIRNLEHNCWSDNCEDDAQEMEAAILAWKTKYLADVAARIAELQNGQGGGEPEDNTTYQSETIENVLGGNVTGESVNINLAAGNIYSPFVHTGGAQGYLYAPPGSGNLYDSNANGAGYAEYNFSLTTPGTYKLRGMVQAIPNSEDSFFIKMDNDNFFDWHVNEAQSFQLQEVTQTGSRNDKTFNLTAGAHTLTIRQREDNTKLQTLTVFPAAGSNGLPEGEGLLIYDLSHILGINGVTFQVNISEYDEYSYKVKDPVIVTPTENIKVKNIKPLVNGFYNPQHANWTIVDTTITPAQSLVSPYSMIILKDQGEASDRISFEFEELEVSN